MERSRQSGRKEGDVMWSEKRKGLEIQHKKMKRNNVEEKRGSNP